MVGDGAVGLCGVIAARRLGAEQIIILGRHPDRIRLAKDFGATDVVNERGDEGVERVRELIETHTEGPKFGFLGRARVNVLELNLALDAALGEAASSSR